MSSSISNSDSVVPFVVRFMTFCIPLVLLMSPLEVFLWKTGESRSASAVIEMQADSDEEILYGRGLLNQQFNVYKVEGWKKHQPKIVVVGSSRVWKLRSFAFHPLESSFYNAGGILQCSSDLSELSKMIANGTLPKPEAMIVGIDPWWYKVNHRNQTWLDGPSLRDDSFRIAARRNVLKRLLNEPSLLQRTLDTDRYIGIYGNSGFRFDGTKKTLAETVEEFLRNPSYVDRESPPIIERIHGLSGRFSPSTGSDKVLSESVEALSRLRLAGVRIIAYFPPFADDSWNAIVGSESIMEWMNYYTDRVIPALSSKSDEVIDLCHSNTFQLDDTYFLDGMHPGEVFATLQWLKLVEREQGKDFYSQFAPTVVRTRMKERSTPLAFDD